MSSHNPFASPQTATRFGSPVQNSAASAVFGGAIWRSGNCLVVGHDTRLPDRCVKCNGATPNKRKMKLAWHSPVAYVGLLLGLIPYVLLAIGLQKRLTVHVGLCSTHVAKRRKAILLGTLGIFAGIAVLIVGGVQENPWIALGGFVLLMFSVFYLVFAPRIVWAKKITRDHAWIKGVAPEYLAGMAEFPLP